MALLLSYSEQQAIKPISQNSASKYAQLAAEVESLEIDKLLGSAFYQAIVAAPADYDNLLSIYEFARSDETLITHKGLKYVIAFLNYAKYIGESYVFDTFTGPVQKLRPDSERISTGDIKRIQQENKEIAFNAFILVKEYLDLKSDLYPLWNCTSNRRISKPVFYGVKKTTV